MERPLLVQPLDLAGTPVLHVAARSLEGPAPTILLYHGWMGRKESMIIAAEALACEGFRVILPDLPRHGERNPLPDYQSAEAWSQYWEIIMAGIDDVARLVEAAISQGLAAPQRIGIGGSSAGGKVAASALARNPRLKAAVLLNSYPCFEQLIQARPGVPVPEAVMARLRTYDPLALADQVAPRPLLMLHGLADTILPVEGVRHFHQQAAPLYAGAPDQLQLVELPRLDHWVTVGMVSSMRDWFTRWI